MRQETDGYIGKAGFHSSFNNHYCLGTECQNPRPHHMGVFSVQVKMCDWVFKYKTGFIAIFGIIMGLQ